MKTKKIQLRCPNCGSPIMEQTISDFENSIRKSLQLELDKKQTELNKQRSDNKRLSEQLIKEREQAEHKSLLKIKEREKVIQDLKKKLDEARKRAESAFSSQQLAGEVQELALENILRNLFPTDEIVEVKKGQLGADAIQIVKLPDGREVGKIIYESKRTAAFSDSWVRKLKHDNLRSKADVLVLCTSAMPKNIQGRFGVIDNVWICSLSDIKELSMVLRYGLLKVHAVTAAGRQKESSMELLYKFLTSQEFKDLFESIVDGFKNLQESHQSEKLKMQRLWKEREKLLEHILSQAISFYGSIKGIAGAAIPEMKNLETLPEGD